MELYYYVYILYSEQHDKYYIGYTSNPSARLEVHNTVEGKNTYTSKYRPWRMEALFSCGRDKQLAIKTERWIKRQKSRKLLQRLIDNTIALEGMMAQLVRVPHERD
ncbi:MAG: GIY-YIG nuclease family protein [Bacteroidota bacterium]|nr:GIY-YIG nuclease family protein [Bacteroidota bacterium]